MPGRTYRGGDKYRYGYQNQEEDPEFWGGAVSNGMMFTITKKDTVNKAIVTKNKDYFNLVYLSKSGNIEKLKLLANVNSKLKVNEIIYFNPDHSIADKSFIYKPFHLGAL